MDWRTLNFGKYKGKTLPQVLFIDPDWFFWAIENNRFSSNYAKDVAVLNSRARNIRIPQKDTPRKLVAEYYIHPQTNSFDHMELVPVSLPFHDGATRTERKPVIDLRLPYEISNFDKTGNTSLLQSVKKLYFGDHEYRMTKKRAEAFFENIDNFDIRDSD